MNFCRKKLDIKAFLYHYLFTHLLCLLHLSQYRDRKSTKLEEKKHFIGFFHNNIVQFYCLFHCTLLTRNSYTCLAAKTHSNLNGKLLGYFKVYGCFQGIAPTKLKKKNLWYFFLIGWSIKNHSMNGIPEEKVPTRLEALDGIINKFIKSNIREGG